MTDITRHRSLRFLLLFASISLQFVSGFSGDSSGSNNDTKDKTPAKSSSTSGTEIFLILLGVVAVVLFSLFLFKLWQKKKRDEQYARLLKLFEEDDELEVELGIRD